VLHDNINFGFHRVQSFQRFFGALYLRRVATFAHALFQFGHNVIDLGLVAAPAGLNFTQPRTADAHATAAIALADAAKFTVRESLGLAAAQVSVVVFLCVGSMYVCIYQCRKERKIYIRRMRWFVTKERRLQRQRSMLARYSRVGSRHFFPFQIQNGLERAASKVTDKTQHPTGKGHAGINLQTLEFLWILRHGGGRYICID